jgi:hypothetical protein
MKNHYAAVTFVLPALALCLSAHAAKENGGKMSVLGLSQLKISLVTEAVTDSSQNIVKVEDLNPGLVGGTMKVELLGPNGARRCFHYLLGQKASEVSVPQLEVTIVNPAECQ